jgi:hypothetical protein
MKRLIGLVLTASFVLSTTALAFAQQPKPGPQPPKCTPRSTPGCSGK